MIVLHVLFSGTERHDVILHRSVLLYQKGNDWVHQCDSSYAGRSRGAQRTALVGSVRVLVQIRAASAPNWSGSRSKPKPDHSTISQSRGGAWSLLPAALGTLAASGGGAARPTGEGWGSATRVAAGHMRSGFRAFIDLPRFPTLAVWIACGRFAGPRAVHAPRPPLPRSAPPLEWFGRPPPHPRTIHPRRCAPQTTCRYASSSLRRRVAICALKSGTRRRCRLAEPPSRPRGQPRMHAATPCRVRSGRHTACASNVGALTVCSAAWRPERNKKQGKPDAGGSLKKSTRPVQPVCMRTSQYHPLPHPTHFPAPTPPTRRA